MMMIIIRIAGEYKDGSHDKDSDGKEVVTKYKEMNRWCQFLGALKKQKQNCKKKEYEWL